VLDGAEVDSGWEQQGAVLARSVDRGTVLVAHGLAVPAAIQAAQLTPVAGLVLSNGPVRPTRLTRVLTSMAGAPFGVAIHAFRPPVSTSVLASSLALRRLVVNPYVMDRDTVAALSDPLFADTDTRRAVRAYVSSLAELPDVRALRCPTLLAWGDADPIFSAGEASFVEAALPGSRYARIPGGQHLHPEERPWALADLVAAWRLDQGPER
jgi:pimeloyl-ACP methyl ester carboxylesterase